MLHGSIKGKEALNVPLRYRLPQSISQLINQSINQLINYSTNYFDNTRVHATFV